MKALEALLQAGVEDGVFPHARAEVWRRGELLFKGGNAAEGAIFDVASLTKVMAGTGVALALKLDPTRKLREFFPTAVDVTLDDLFFHRSGLPAFHCYFAHEMNAEPRLFEHDCPAEVRATVRQSLLDAVIATPQSDARGSAAVYSDLSFILLGEVLAKVGDAPLDQLFARHVAQPLGLRHTRYRRISANLPEDSNILPTGATRPREPAPGQEGLWKVPLRPTGPGEVDDDNAFCLDGVSGHAGLFSTCEDVARYGRAILDGTLAPPQPWAKDATTPNSTRAFGFDTPSAEGSSVGARFGRKGPKGAIGHLGFTGTSLWLDFDRGLVVSLLTNRVALGRANVKIREYRARFHDAVIAELEPQ